MRDGLISNLPHEDKIDWPTQDELMQLTAQYGYSGAGRKLGVSDNAIRKRLKKLSELGSRQDAGW